MRDSRIRTHVIGGPSLLAQRARRLDGTGFVEQASQAGPQRRRAARMVGCAGDASLQDRASARTCATGATQA